MDTLIEVHHKNSETVQRRFRGDAKFAARLEGCFESRYAAQSEDCRNKGHFLLNCEGIDCGFQSVCM